MNIQQTETVRDPAALTGAQGMADNQQRTGYQAPEPAAGATTGTDSYSITENARRLQEALQNGDQTTGTQTPGARKQGLDAAVRPNVEEPATQQRAQKTTAAPATTTQRQQTAATGQNNKPMLDLFG